MRGVSITGGRPKEHLAVAAAAVVVVVDDMGVDFPLSGDGLVVADVVLPHGILYRILVMFHHWASMMPTWGPTYPGSLGSLGFLGIESRYLVYLGTIHGHSISLHNIFSR